MLPVLLAACLALAQTPATAAMRDVTAPSAALGRPMTYRVLLPQDYATSAKRYPVLYLLHGLDGHFDDWSTRTDLAARARALPLVIVMPEGGDSWYTNADDGSGRFEDYITSDLIKDVEARFRVIRSRYGRVVAGLSMGGYGAIKMALKHPGLFAAAGSLSGAFDATDPAFAEMFPPQRDAMGKIFGPAAGQTRRENDVYALANAVVVASAPALYIDCGTSDGLLESSRRLVEIVQRRGLAYEYHETPGTHAWDYWNRRLDVLLPWAMTALKSASGR
jgi:putative tributyrin esterase